MNPTAVFEYVPGCIDAKAPFPIAVLVSIFPLPRPMVIPFTRISFPEKLAITLAAVAPE